MDCYEIFEIQVVKNIFPYYVQLVEFHHVVKCVNALLAATLFFSFPAL
jgi:hypothetical protein